MKISVTSPLEYLVAFGIAFGAGVLTTSVATAYASWLQRQHGRR